MSKPESSDWTESKMVARAQDIAAQTHMLPRDRFLLREQIVKAMHEATNDYSKTVARLEYKIRYYEEPLPMGKGNCYHRFTDEGVCVRCGEDAESWDAGCVEELVEDLMSVTEPAFIDALTGLLADGAGEPYDTVSLYLTRLEYFASQFEHAKRLMDVLEDDDSKDDDEPWELNL